MGGGPGRPVPCISPTPIPTLYGNRAYRPDSLAKYLPQGVGGGSLREGAGALAKRPRAPSLKFFAIIFRMSPTRLPPAAAVARLLIWHQGALGDLLLAGPALAALSRHYAGARITALGHPERWGLYSRSLPLDEVWDSGEARWAHLFSDGDVPPAIKARLARFQLALVFSPHPQTILPDRLHQAGIPAVHWLPSFPETGVEAVAALQARHLGGLGLALCPRPLQTGSGTLSG